MLNGVKTTLRCKRSILMTSETVQNVVRAPGPLGLHARPAAKISQAAQGYAALAFEILSLYIDDIPAPDLKAICEKTYTAAIFGNPAITPLKKLEGGLYLEALSNGPTLAFKDMAMQFLGQSLE